MRQVRFFMARDRPTYSKWTRRAGGYKICPACHRKHPEMMRINGRPQRPKACVKCGAVLLSSLTYPKKGRVLWFVRESDPITGQISDHPCKSSEDADELIRQKERDFTRDPIQERLIEHASVLIRQIKVDELDEAVNTTRRRCARESAPSSTA